MSRDANHDQAQELAAEAARLFREGRRREAVTQYAEAAKLEQIAFRAIPRDKPRTRGILAVSTASLLYKARKLDEGERFIFALLSDDDLLPAHRGQLRELLEVVWDEKSLPPGTEYSGEEIWVALRGGEVGFGTAPLDLALTKSAEVRNLIVRTTEWKSGVEFRFKGAPSKSVRDLVQARATQPGAGSYRFAIRLVEPAQAEMFPLSAVGTPDIGSSLFEVIKVATSGTPDAGERLEKLVPSREYRHALVKLLRNVVPSDRGLREVELTRVSHPVDRAGEPQRDAVLLAKDVRNKLSEVLQREEPEPDAAMEIRGVLRALHLDQGWLEIAKDDGGRQRCETDKNVLDDVVGPMVNRRVIVRGGTKGPFRRFRLIDIELEPEK